MEYDEGKERERERENERQREKKKEKERPRESTHPLITPDSTMKFGRKSPAEGACNISVFLSCASGRSRHKRERKGLPRCPGRATLTNDDEQLHFWRRILCARYNSQAHTKKSAEKEEREREAEANAINQAKRRAPTSACGLGATGKNEKKMATGVFWQTFLRASSNRAKGALTAPAGRSRLPIV